MRPVKKQSSAGKTHVFRLVNPPAQAIKTATAAFAKRQRESYEQWAEYRRHQNVIQESLTERLYGNETLSPKVTASLDALRHSLSSRAPIIRDHHFPGLPIFNVTPGLNVLGPPYDFGLNMALGSNKPAVMVDTASGSFGVSASASGGNNTWGAAGVALFVVPSDPARTLSIRPYFQWQYTYSCESHGPPTAHSVGDVSAEVSGAAKDFPGKHMHLWSGSSDAWNDGVATTVASSASPTRSSSFRASRIMSSATSARPAVIRTRTSWDGRRRSCSFTAVCPFSW